MKKIKKAFVLAAGLGTRMQPLTDSRPKPLIEVDGRTMIDRALDRLVEFGVEEAIVNTHYKPEMIEEHLAKRKDIEISFSREKERLETGGGLLHARDKLGNDPVFVVSTDIVWQDSGKTGLETLAENWDDKLVGLLLLNQVATGYGYDGRGDFKLYQDGRIEWRDADNNAPYVFTGLQIICPKVFDRPAIHEMGPVFALNKLYTLYLENFRGVEYHGKWYHIGTPEALKLLPSLRA